MVDVFKIKQQLLGIVKMSDILRYYGVYTSNNKANCPLHIEDTPSFTYDDDLKTYHCFGCHRKGTAVEFLISYERIHNNKVYTQEAAIKELAERFKVNLEGIEDLGKGGISRPKKMERKRYEIDKTKLNEKRLENIIEGIRRHQNRGLIYKVYDQYLLGRIKVEDALRKIEDILGGDD